MPTSIPAASETLLRRARTELESGLRAGKDVHAEGLFAAYPVLVNDPEAVLELVYSEFVAREELGQSPSPEEWYARFPHLRTDLEQMFGLHDELRSAEASLPAWSAGGTRRVGRIADQGERIGDYEVLGEIGRGGMGVVYRARQSRLDRVVALKVILSGVHAGKKERNRFQREVLSAARLDHPNIVRVYEVGEHDGHPYCAMEHVSGGSLADLMTGQAWSVDAAVGLVALLARAAHHAHERGVVHRDIKPANILIAPAGHDPDDAIHCIRKPAGTGAKADPSPESICPKIADFGLAKCLYDLEPSLTLTGDVVGTPAYMAPEQAEGSAHQPGAPTDVWALGVILYELLTGRPPFHGDSTAETLKLVQRDEPVSPRAVCPKLPRDIETICLKCLEKSPSRRYATAAGLANDLERWRRREPILARHVGTLGRSLRWVRRHPSTAIWLGVVALITTLGLGGVTWYAFHAENRRREAESAHRLARDARDEARASLYYQQVGRAFLEWQSCNQASAENLLASAASYGKDWEWRYVHGLCNDDLLTLDGHPDHVSSVVYSPDGRRIASATGAWAGSLPGEIRLWDAQTGRLIRTIRTNKGPIRGMAFSPDGRRIATASLRWQSARPGGVFFWDAETGAGLGTLAGIEKDNFAVAYSPDGRLLATGGVGGLVRLWDVQSGTEIATLGRHATSGVHGVAFSPDGRRLVSGGWDGTVRIWDVENRKQALPPMGGIGDIRGVAYSPDGRHVAASAYGTVVRVWDAWTGEVVATHNRHESPALAIAYSPDGFFLASADNSGMVHVREALNQVGRGHVLRGQTNGVLALAFSPDGTRLATAGVDGTVRVRNAWSPQDYRVFSSRGIPPASQLAYSPDGRTLASVAVSSSKRTQLTVRDIEFWDVKTGTIDRSLHGHEQGVSCIAYNRAGDLIASGSLDQTVRVWETATGKPLSILRGHKGTCNGVAFDPSGDRVASVGDDGTLRLWHPRDERALRVIDLGSGPQRRVTFSPDGSLLATAGADGVVRLWEAADLRPRETRTLYDAPITDLAFSPDGRRLASSSEDSRVVLWEWKTGKLTRLAPVHSRGVTGLAFSPDGRRLATSSRDWSVRLWDVQTGAEAFTLHARRGEALCVAFRPDNGQIAASLRDEAEIYLWDEEGERSERTARAANDGVAWHRDTALAARAARHWFSARFHLDHILAPLPDNAHFLQQRSDAFAELGDFERARRDLAHACTSPAASRGAISNLALLRLHAGDRDGYRDACRLALLRFGETSNATIANDVAWIFTYGPDAGADLPRALSLSEMAVAAAPKSSNHENTLGALLYRSGRFEESLSHLLTSVRLQKAGGLVEDWLYLAMVHERLGYHEDAQRWLSKASSYLSALPADKPGTPPTWDDTLANRLLEREAESLISARN